MSGTYSEAEKKLNKLHKEPHVFSGLNDDNFDESFCSRNFHQRSMEKKSFDQQSEFPQTAQKSRKESATINFNRNTAVNSISNSKNKENATSRKRQASSATEAPLSKISKLEFSSKQSGRYIQFPNNQDP